MSEGTILAPECVEADFLFRCCDDSMMNANLFTGAMVFVRACDDVDDGQIAVVRMGGGVALRRVYHGPDYLELRSENPMYPPAIIRGQSSGLEILGAAVKALCDVI